MPPKRRTNARSAQQLPQSTQSDYETDTPNNNVQPAPPPARTNTELNLLVLRRYHPNLTHILSIAPFAVIYTFSPVSQTWEKHGVEGTLFVCQLDNLVSGEPEYKVTILNRKAPDTFTTDLVSAENVEVTEEYVILQTEGRGGEPVIYGLWIFEDGEGEGGSRRESVAGVIASCALLAQEANEIANATGREEDDVPVEDSETEGNEYGFDGSSIAPKPALSEGRTHLAPTQAGQPLDLMQLFAKAPAPTLDQGGHDTQPAVHSTPSNYKVDAQSRHAGNVAPAPQQTALLNLFKR